MSAPIRVKVEADIEGDIGSGIGSNKATQDLWRLAESPAETLAETPGKTNATEQLEDLLARGADINARDAHGITALVRAVYKGRLQMVRDLIDHGADLNATRDDGVTPLGLAAFFGHTDVVRVLVERGADLGKVTRLGTSAEMWATARSFYGIAQYLERERSSALESSAPERSANRSGIMPTPGENEPGDEVPTAEPMRAEQPEQPSLADSDLTIATPRIMFPDQLVSQHLEENVGTAQEHEHASAKPSVVVPDRLTSQHSEENENGRASAKPVVVRTLKDPPEIWDLVHEAPQDFNPRGAFVTRLTSSKTNLILLTLAVMFIAGLGAFAVKTLRDGGKLGGAATQVQEERGTSHTLPASPASAPASAPNAQVNAPVNTDLNTQFDKTPNAGAGVDNTPPTPTNPQTTDPQPPNPQPIAQPDNPASVTNSIQPTGESVNNISSRTGSRAGAAAAFSGKKRVRVGSGRRNVDKPARVEGETAAGADSGAKARTPQTEKESNGTSNTTSSQQLTAPPKASSTPKPKVIQWP